MGDRYTDSKGIQHRFPDDSTPEQIQAAIQEIDAQNAPKSLANSLKEFALARKQPTDRLFQGMFRGAGNLDVSQGLKEPDQVEGRADLYSKLLPYVAAGGTGGPIAEAAGYAPAVGRIIGPTTVSGIQPPGEGESRIGNMLKTAGATALLEGAGAALPGLLSKFGSWGSRKPSITTRDLTYAKTPAPGGANSIISGTEPISTQRIPGYDLPVAGPIPQPARAGDIIRETGTVTTQPKVTVPNIPGPAQAAANAPAGTEEGRSGALVGAYLMLPEWLKRKAGLEEQGYRGTGRGRFGGY